MRHFDTRNEMIVHYASLINEPKIMEIGIFKGEFFDFIVINCKPSLIDGVDLFEGNVPSGNADGNNLEWYDIGKSFIELTQKYSAYPHINLHKSDSSTFLNNCADSYYDIVYIDGDHSYAGVKKDLESALRKVKNGGYIMGHDYEMNMNKARNVYDFGVKRAVDEFCAKHKLPIIAKGLDGCVSFCIQVLH
jgi:hypothetical protein